MWWHLGGVAGSIVAEHAFVVCNVEILCGWMWVLLSEIEFLSMSMLGEPVSMLLSRAMWRFHVAGCGLYSVR